MAVAVLGVVESMKVVQMKGVGSLVAWKVVVPLVVVVPVVESVVVAQKVLVVLVVVGLMEVQMVMMVVVVPVWVLVLVVVAARILFLVAVCNRAFHPTSTVALVVAEASPASGCFPASSPSFVKTCSSMGAGMLAARLRVLVKSDIFFTRYLTKARFNCWIASCLCATSQ